MSKRINVTLSSKSIEKAIQALNEIKNNLNKVSENIVDDLSEIALEEMQNNYSNTQSQYEGNTDITFSKEGDSKKKKISMKGVSAFYLEFGTGTLGATSPHENKKSEYNLNPYNSGKTIRMNNSTNSNASKHGIPLNTLYWTYKDSDGNRVYTQGIPAQMIVYKSAKTVREKMKSVIKKRIKEELR